MQHHSFCSRKHNLDADIYFTKIGHTKLKVTASLCETILEDMYLKEN